MSYCLRSETLEEFSSFQEVPQDIDSNVNEGSHVPVRFSSSQLPTKPVVPITPLECPWNSVFVQLIIAVFARLRSGTSSDPLGARLLSNFGEADSVGMEGVRSA